MTRDRHSPRVHRGRFAIACSVGILSALIAGVALRSLPAAANEPQGPIRPGFETGRAAAIVGRSSTAFQCPAVPPPVTEMGGFQSRYDPKDPTQSKVDPARVAAEAGRESKLRAFSTQLARLADAAILSRPPDPAIAECIWDHLARWAEAGALLQDVERNDRVGRRQAAMTQAWQVATYAAVGLKVSNGKPVAPGGKRAEALAWMKRLCEAAMAEDRDANPWTRLNANHLYWVGVAAAFTSALTQDRAMEAFALEALRRGLEDVSETGALNREMRRGNRALLYQNFALLPLAMLVRFAEANGHALSGEQRDALLRLVRFTVDANRDPDKVAAIVHVAQAALNDRSALVWTDVIAPTVARIDPATAQRLAAFVEESRLGPGWHIYAGGAVTAVYNPDRLSALRASGH